MTMNPSISQKDIGHIVAMSGFFNGEGPEKVAYAIEYLQGLEECQTFLKIFKESVWNKYRVPEFMKQNLFRYQNSELITTFFKFKQKTSYRRSEK